MGGAAGVCGMANVLEARRSVVAMVRCFKFTEVPWGEMTAREL